MHTPQQVSEHSQVVWHFMPSEPIHDWSQPHAWLCDLDVAAKCGFDDLLLLSFDERQRAFRLKSPLLQQRFVVSRVVLRHVLSLCLESDPSELQFGDSPFGKPFAAGPDHLLTSRLSFNLSHSDHVLLLAVTLDREVGVDIEVLRDDLGWPLLAESHFSPAEIAYLTQVSPADYPREFYRAWTRHESRAKCIGIGIARPVAMVLETYPHLRFENNWDFGNTHAVSTICFSDPCIAFRRNDF